MGAEPLYCASSVSLGFAPLSMPFITIIVVVIIIAVAVLNIKLFLYQPRDFTFFSDSLPHFTR